MINGHWFLIPIDGRYGYPNFSAARQERGVANLLKRLLPMNGTFVDVGANVGQTLLLVKSVDRETKYLGIEPNIECCSYLSRLIRFNGFQNADIISGAASDNAGLSSLHIPRGASQISTFHPNYFGTHRYHGTQTTPLFTLDSLEKKDIGVLKVDVEGHEAQVIKGASGMIRRQPFPVLFEALASKDNVSRLDRVLETEQLLRGFGYTLSRVETDGSLSEVDTLVSDRDGNYLATR